MFRLNCGLIAVFAVIISQSEAKTFENPHKRHVSSLSRNIRSPNPEDSSRFLREGRNLTSSEEGELELDRISSSYGKFTLPKDYNKLAIPLSTFGGGVYVYVSIFVHTILDVDEKKGELVLDTDFGLQWIDWKIYDNLVQNNWKDPKTNIPIANRTLDSEALKEIWKPDVFIDEMASVDRTSILAKLITLNFLSETGTSSKGEIVYSARTTLNLQCDMYFEYYPADTQECKYYIRSYSYPMDQLTIHWSKPPSKGIFLQDPEDANFDLQISSAEPHKELKNLRIEEKFDKFRRANYSALVFTIKARRKLSYHIVQTYLPSVLLILITWLCFLIPSTMVEARIGISMTTVLTLTAMFAAVREQSPSVSYTMAIDIWMVFCIFFVFLALLMFTLIYWMKLRLTKKQEVNEKNAAAPAVDDEESPNQIDIQNYESFVGFARNYAFWTFATVFILFFCIYWGWLLTFSGYFQWYPNPLYNAVDDQGDSNDLYMYHEEVRKPNYNSEEERENETKIFDELIKSLDDFFKMFNDLNETKYDNLTTTADDGNNTLTTDMEIIT